MNKRIAERRKALARLAQPYLAPANTVYLKSMHRFIRQEKSPAEFGRSLVIAPHQDDEVLGCGGVIAMLGSLGRDVGVVYMGDGRASHRSEHLSPVELGEHRECEAHRAMAVLGVDEADFHFLRLPETAFPLTDSQGGPSAVARLTEIIARRAPDTVFLPLRLDPNHDHRATFALAARAIAKQGRPVRLIEYPVWFWERAWFWQIPPRWIFKRLKVDIGEVLDIKKAALAAYRSQMTRMFDDPDWAVLQEPFLANFFRSHEVFFELGGGGR